MNKFDDLFTFQQWLNTKGLSIYEKLLCVVLFIAADDGVECSLSIPALARRCSCSRSQVMKVLNSLEDKNLISRKAQYLDAPSHQTANRYTLRFDV